MSRKVLHLTEYLHQGGIERLLELISRKNANDDNLVFFSYEMNSPTGMAEIIQKRHSLYTYKKDRGHDKNVVLQLEKIIKEHNINIVHTHDFGPMEYAVHLKIRNPRIKLIHTQHTLHHFLPHLKYRWFFQFASLFYKKIIAVSDTVLDSLNKSCPFLRGKRQIIYNGVDVEEFKNCSKRLPPSKDLKIISVSRISPEKNIDFLIETCSLLKNQNIPFTWTHVGSGSKDLEKRVQNKITEKGIGKYCHFPGFKKNITPYLREADIFITCSKTEGHPVSLLEAMASKKICLCSNIKPHRFLDTESVTYFEINHPKSLYNVLETIHNDPLIYLSKKRNALNEVRRRFSIQSMIKTYQETYKELTI